MNDTLTASAADPFEESTTRVGIFDLGLAVQPVRGWVLAIPVATLALVGAIAFIGQYRNNHVAAGLGRLAPLPDIVTGCLGLSVLIGIVGLLTRRKSLAVLAAGVAGFLAGHLLFAVLPFHDQLGIRIPFQSFADGVSFSLHRVAYGLCVGLPAFLAVWLTGWWLDSLPAFSFGVGSWRVVSRAFTRNSEPESYARAMIGFVVFAGILWGVGQMGVELKPLRAGTLWPLLPAVLLASFVNATVEELLFRGVLQPAIIQVAGVARGLWIQGLLFGLMHWGMSVGQIAALPTSLLIGVGAVFWGKAVLETRGLSWVIVAHTLVDVAILSAYFVPHQGG